MRKLTNSLLMLLTSAFLMFACGGDDADPKKQFTVEGESYALKNGYFSLLGSGEDDDGNEIFGHYVLLTGGDLEVDGGEFDGEGDMMQFMLIGSDEDIAEGTYEFGDDEEAGVFGQFIAYTDYKGASGSYDRIFGAAEGTIKVSKSGDKYTFKVNITEFITLDEEGHEVEGDGSIKGYFKGELEDVTPEEEEPVRKPKNFKSPFAQGFNF